MKKIKLGNEPIMFGDSECTACQAQIKLLMDSLGKEPEIIYYDLHKYDAPDFLVNSRGEVQMPSWYIPTGNGMGTIHTGIIQKNLNKLVSQRKKSRFGACTAGDGTIPQIDSLKECGKNFPNGQGLNIPNSFMTDIKNKWGDDYLVAGTVGREFTPETFKDKIYSNNYFNDIRMAQPAGQLGTLLADNRECNYMQNKVPQFHTPGLIYDSKNPQIVGFGRKKSRFGNKLYNQMGPPYGIDGSNYVMGKNTVRDLFGGGIQDNYPRAGGVNNNSIYLGGFPTYKPMGSPWSQGLNAEFGRKKKRVGEGSVLSIKNNKIKVN